MQKGSIVYLVFDASAYRLTVLRRPGDGEDSVQDLEENPSALTVT